MGSILIRDGAVLAPGGWLDPGYVLIEGDRIAAVGPGTPSADVASRAGQVVVARHMAVLPGLTNAHTHLSQSLMRGLAAGRPLLRWLEELVWPLQAAMTVEEMRLAATLGLVENLRAGATHVVDHHKVTTTPAHTDAVCRAAQAVGVRLTVARSWADRGVGAEAGEHILADLERLLGQWAGSAVIRVANGPLAPWRCTARTLQATQDLARRHGAPLHIHLSETRREVQMTVQETGLAPVAWLDSLGLVGPDLQAVHAVWLDEAEMDLLARRGASVVHCPVSNAILGSGAAPVAALRRRGVEIRLGTDGPASNDRQDLFEAAKWALGLARVAALEPTALSPAEALSMATAGRTLSPSAPADLIVVDLNTPRAAPVHDTASALILCSQGTDVDTAIVAGQVLLRNRRLTGLDEEGLLGECRAAAAALLRRAGVERPSS